MELILDARPPGPAIPPPDALVETLARTAAGDDRALTALYDATSAQVYGWALRILRDEGAAEEVALDVFAQIWKKAGQYDPGRGSVRGWILALARNRAIDRLRADKRGIRREGNLEATAGLTDGAADPESAAHAAHQSRLIILALESLPPEQRRAIEAAFWGGMTHMEVSEALGAPLGTVKTRIRNGLNTLRRVLADAMKEGA